jgi:hypothetical protein
MVLIRIWVFHRLKLFHSNLVSHNPEGRLRGSTSHYSLHLILKGIPKHRQAKMGVETVDKRMSDDSSPQTAEFTSNKRRKLDDETPEMMASHSHGSKVDASELASAFALASLASLSPNKPTQPPKDDESRTEQTSSTDRTAEESVSASTSWEARSPKADPAPVTPDVRAPAGLFSAHYSRKVHFAANASEYQQQVLQMQMEQQIQMQRMQQQHQHQLRQQQPKHVLQGPMPAPTSNAVPPSPHLSATPGRGMVMLSPRSPHAQLQRPFMPRSPHPHLGMHAFVRPQHRQFLPPGHLPQRHPQPGHPPLHHQIPASPHAAWAQGRMFPPPATLMQPPLMHPENQWICDYCNVAAFATYQEACTHEDTCKLRCSMRPVIREQHAVTRIRRQGPPAGGIKTADPQQVYSGAALVASRSNSGDEEASVMSGAPTVQSSSSGEQCWFTGSTSLAITESDHEWLSELNCHVREHCVEAFSASAEDMAKTSKRGRIAINQVGIRCLFCAHLPLQQKAVAAVSFPTSVAGIYESVKRWQRVHLEACPAIPPEVKSNLAALADSNVWVPTTRQYWTDSAKALGLVDTSDGIRFGCNPQEIGKRGVRHMVSVGSNDPILQSYDGVSSFGHPPRGVAISGNAMEGSMELVDTSRSDTAATSDEDGHIVLQGDMEMIPPYVYFLMRQVESCSFTEADRFVARSKGPVGYPGFQCRHCNGHAGLGKYFPVSAKSLSTNSTSQNIHAHLLKCRKCPDAVKDRLVQLKLEKSRSPRMEPGWRKIFFDKVWGRLHD